MAQDVFWIGCENSPVTGQGIEITVTLNNGTFSSNYQSMVFYGVAPSWSGTYPAQFYSTGAAKLNFSGNINSLYCELQVLGQGAVIEGQISAKQVSGSVGGIPVPVSIGTYSGGRFTLPANTASATFKLGIADSVKTPEPVTPERLKEAVQKAAP